MDTIKYCRKKGLLYIVDGFGDEYDTIESILASDEIVKEDSVPTKNLTFDIGYAADMVMCVRRKVSNYMPEVLLTSSHS